MQKLKLSAMKTVLQQISRLRVTSHVMVMMMTEQTRLQQLFCLHSLRNWNTSILTVIPSQPHLSLLLLPTLFMVRLLDLFRMEEKQVNLLHLAQTHLTVQSRTVFLLPWTLLPSLTMKMLLTVSPILRQSILMLWDTVMTSVQRIWYMYLTDTLIRVLITSM